MGHGALDKAINAAIEENSMAAGAVQGGSGTFEDEKVVRDFNEKEKQESKLKGIPLAEDDIVEQQLRKYIRNRKS